MTAAAALAVVRIAQEALTNTLVRSTARTATLTLRDDEDVLGLVVAEPGPAAPDTCAGGPGLLNMRKRASADGRELDGATGRQLVRAGADPDEA